MRRSLFLIYVKRTGHRHVPNINDIIFEGYPCVFLWHAARPTGIIIGEVCQTHTLSHGLIRLPSTQWQLFHGSAKHLVGSEALIYSIEGFHEIVDCLQRSPTTLISLRVVNFHGCYMRLLIPFFKNSFLPRFFFLTFQQEIFFPM